MKAYYEVMKRLILVGILIGMLGVTYKMLAFTIEKDYVFLETPEEVEMLFVRKAFCVKAKAEWITQHFCDAISATYHMIELKEMYENSDIETWNEIHQNMFLTNIYELCYALNGMNDTEYKRLKYIMLGSPNGEFGPLFTDLPGVFGICQEVID